MVSFTFYSSGGVTCTEYAVSLMAEMDVIAAAHGKAPQKLLTVTEVCLGLDSTFFEIHIPGRGALTRQGSFAVCAFVVQYLTVAPAPWCGAWL